MNPKAVRRSSERLEQGLDGVRRNSAAANELLVVAFNTLGFVEVIQMERGHGDEQRPYAKPR